MTVKRLEQSVPPKVTLLIGSSRRELKTLGLVSLETRQFANLIPNAKLVLSQPNGDGGDPDAFAADANRCQPGAEVTIQLEGGGLLFKGVVAEQACSQSQGRNELTLKLCHPLQGAVSSHGSKVFAKQNDEAVLRHLLNRYNVKLSRATGLLPVRHPQLVQYECSDWQFIKARLGANGVWLWPDKDGSISVAAPKLKVVTHALVRDSSSLESTVGNHTLVESAEWVFNNRELTDNVSVSAWNPGLQKMESRKASTIKLGSGGLDPAQLKCLGRRNQSFNAALDLQEGERQAWADSRLLAMQAASVQGRFTVIGSTEYQLGDTLELKGFGGTFDGRGIIRGVEHTLRPGRWRTVVTIGQDNLRDVDSPLLPAAPGLQIGVVTTYQRDPDRLGRLRVKVPVLEGELWARFATPYASENSGVCFYPEPGDEVVLGFFGEDPRYPVILGAMHNPRKPAPIDPMQGRQQKGLILKQGNSVQQLLFERQPECVLLQAGEDKLALRSGIDMDSPQAVQIKGANVTVKASANLEVSGKLVKVKGSKVDLGM